MKRYTAMRAAKIASALVCPPILLTWYLSLVYDWRNHYLPALFVLFALTAHSPALCADPIAEDEAARTRRDKRRSIIAISIGLSTAFIVYWLSGHPQVMAFFTHLKPQLRDWKPTAVMALLCLQLMRMGLRKALAFKVTDLYPHLRRAEQAAAR
ncbi:MAG: hypothetical protein B7Z37_12010 [Verrucomicrobia bacterium 12-59-8]|nr:MAG: hypothetical protein B7Z37_12010 [Verrucomicrobia bacterium 12-59-8]